jgi:hypothetical protein
MVETCFCWIVTLYDEYICFAVGFFAWATPRGFAYLLARRETLYFAARGVIWGISSFRDLPGASRLEKFARAMALSRTHRASASLSKRRKLPKALVQRTA